MILLRVSSELAGQQQACSENSCGSVRVLASRSPCSPDAGPLLAALLLALSLTPSVTAPENSTRTTGSSSRDRRPRSGCRAPERCNATAGALSSFSSNHPAPDSATRTGLFASLKAIVGWSRLKAPAAASSPTGVDVLYELAPRASCHRARHADVSESRTACSVTNTTAKNPPSCAIALLESCRESAHRIRLIRVVERGPPNVRSCSRHGSVMTVEFEIAGRRSPR